MDESSTVDEQVAMQPAPAHLVASSPSTHILPAVALPQDVAAVKTEASPNTSGRNSSTPMPASDMQNLEASSNSTLQPASAKIAADSEQAQPADATSADAPTYGTRSRNRTGNARINYAEDQEMDFEYSAAAKNEAKRVTQLANDTKLAKDPVSAKFVPVNGSSQSDKAPTKDPIPGTLTFSANPTSKKRKAAVGSSNASASIQSPAGSSSAAQTSSRKTAAPLTAAGGREAHVLTFTDSKAALRNGKLTADDGTVFSVNDHVYLVCEPPGDPYYLCRIMEFLHTNSDDPTSPIDSLRVNWFYRPRDVQRYNNDTRLVYGTMHSDMCPLTSLRGKCQILHRSEIDNLDEYRKGKDSFWFSQIFDRFIRRFYEVIPTSQIINVPEKVKKALDERWKFIAVEVGRVKELTSAVKLCKRCSGYCASHDSVECAICHNTYHMNCVSPPLPKKPSRGFAWACGPCGRAQEKKLEARHTPQLGELGMDQEEEIVEEEEEDPALTGSTRAASPSESEMAIDQHPGTQAEIALAKMWPMRYLGIHCRVEDALQYDDRAIYPRASSRLGPRHQANVNVWHGRPVELIKPAEIKKKYIKSTSHKKDGKLSKETIAALEADRVERAKRPKWVLDEPPGYVARGEDYDNDDPRCTAKLMFRMPNEDESADSVAGRESDVSGFVKEVSKLAKGLKVHSMSANLLDKSLELFMNTGYNMSTTLNKVERFDRIKDLNEPVLSMDELKKFEEGAAKYGSEHRAIRIHMKTNLPTSTIIRFYYMWKKTSRGRQIWDNYGGRKSTKKKQQNMDAAAKLQAEVADAADDSAFDSAKAAVHKRGFQCKFCATQHTPQWRRAPGVATGQTVPADVKSGSKEKGHRLLLALCSRCAGLWRKYAIQWEDIDEVAKKVAQGGGKAWKRRIDEELLRELVAANELASRGTPDANMALPSVEGAEPARKKARTGADGPEAAPKKKPPPPPPKAPSPPIVPDQPQMKALVCAVCRIWEGWLAKWAVCSHCKLTVHPQCYGLKEESLPAKWLCEQCSNDRNPVVSTDYVCTLCPIEHTAVEMWEAPKITHKKKTDKDREKETMERDLIVKAKQEYVQRQMELGRPVLPRQALKHTDGNNWVHVTCAIWTPEIKFSKANALEKAEGFSTIPLSRYEAACKICKGRHGKRGACVSCMLCHASFHVGCALEREYFFGFDVTPVKGSRKDQITTVTLGKETGYLTAGIWCRDHIIKTIVHNVDELQPSGQTSIQIFAENYKQADQTLTGTARKANLLSQSTRNLVTATTLPTAANQANRRVSTTNASTSGRKGRNSTVSLVPGDEDGDAASPSNRPESEAPERTCVKCNIDVSPKWWPAEKRPPTPGQNQGYNLNTTLGELADGDRGASVARGVKTETDGEGPLAAASNEHSLDPDAIEYECHKCHWRRLNEPTPPPEAARKSSSPPRTFPMPGWTGHPNGLPDFVPAQPSWPDHQRTPYGALPDPMSHPPPPQLSPGQQFHAPGQVTSNFPPRMQPNGVSYGQPATSPHQFASQLEHMGQHRPRPLSSGPQGAQQLTNGTPPSPHFPMPSPSFPAGGNGALPPQHYAAPPRPSESSFPPPLSQQQQQQQQQPQSLANGTHAAPHYGGHGSPPPNFATPSTPRDGAGDARLGGGASASPSLRNLLH